jgi:hypothetical protein
MGPGGFLQCQRRAQRRETKPREQQQSFRGSDEKGGLASRPADQQTSDALGCLQRECDAALDTACAQELQRGIRQASGQSIRWRGGKRSGMPHAHPLAAITLWRPAAEQRVDSPGPPGHLDSGQRGHRGALGCGRWPPRQLAGVEPGLDPGRVLGADKAHDLGNQRRRDRQPCGGRGAGGRRGGRCGRGPCCACGRGGHAACRQQTPVGAKRYTPCMSCMASLRFWWF